MVKRVEWRQKALRHLGEILFYSVKGSTLFIVDFFDTRQDPMKRPY